MDINVNQLKERALSIITQIKKDFDEGKLDKATLKQYKNQLKEFKKELKTILKSINQTDNGNNENKPDITKESYYDDFMNIIMESDESSEESTDGNSDEINQEIKEIEEMPNASPVLKKEVLDKIKSLKDILNSAKNITKIKDKEEQKKAALDIKAKISGALDWCIKKLQNADSEVVKEFVFEDYANNIADVILEMGDSKSKIKNAETKYRSNQSKRDKANNKANGTLADRLKSNNINEIIKAVIDSQQFKDAVKSEIINDNNRHNDESSVSNRSSVVASETRENIYDLNHEKKNPNKLTGFKIVKGIISFILLLTLVVVTICSIVNYVSAFSSNGGFDNFVGISYPARDVGFVGDYIVNYVEKKYKNKKNEFISTASNSRSYYETMFGKINDLLIKYITTDVETEKNNFNKQLKKLEINKLLDSMTEESIIDLTEYIYDLFLYELLIKYNKHIDDSENKPSQLMNIINYRITLFNNFKILSSSENTFNEYFIDEIININIIEEGFILNKNKKRNDNDITYKCSTIIDVIIKKYISIIEAEIDRLDNNKPNSLFKILCNNPSSNITINNKKINPENIFIDDEDHKNKYKTFLLKTKDWFERNTLGIFEIMVNNEKKINAL